MWQVVNVLITASEDDFKASEIVCFSSGSSFAAEVMFEKIAIQSVVDSLSEHGRVCGVIVIIMGICNSEVRVVARCLHLVTFRQGSIALTCAKSKCHSLKWSNVENSCHSLRLLLACP